MICRYDGRLPSTKIISIYAREILCAQGDDEGYCTMRETENTSKAGYPKSKRESQALSVKIRRAIGCIAEGTTDQNIHRVLVPA